MADKMEEQIIVVPRKALFETETLTFQGTVNEKDNKETVDAIMNNVENNYGVLKRGYAETNERFKQLIPYAVIRRGDEIFMYERLQGGGEERLHNKLSIGVGGHMNKFPTRSFQKLLMENLKRELDEELELSKTYRKLSVEGLINDDKNSEGKVHMGVLVVIDLDSDTEVAVRETEQLDGDFVQLDTLKSKSIYDRLESWSQIAVDNLFK